MYLGIASKRGFVFFGLTVALLTGCVADSALAASGNFVAVLNEQSGNGDSRRSIMFFDADEVDEGPLFSVFIGYELGGTNLEEMSSITVDPVSGDIYVLAFDNTADLDFDTEVLDDVGEDDGTGDSVGDYDLYRIDTGMVYDYWATNHEGEDVRTIVGTYAVGGPAPFLPANDSVTNHKLDYVNYGITNPGAPTFDDFPAQNSNTHTLDGTVTKIGEIYRSVTDPSNFAISAIEFIDEDTLFLMDDSIEVAVNDNAVNDHVYRLLSKVSSSSGAATTTVIDRTPPGPPEVDYTNGGFNLGTSESWESEVVAFSHMDVDMGGSPVGHSEPEQAAYYEDPLSGVKGVWITESDMPQTGDDVAFFVIDDPANPANNFTYREHQVGPGPTYPRQFALDNDPNLQDNRGKADHIFVDQDTGDLIILESGFNDSVDDLDPDNPGTPIDTQDREPGVIRRHVTSYENGVGQIQFGAWEDKVLLDPTKDTMDTFLERGQWSAWDSENDRMFFAAPGGASPETPEFQMDVYVLNLNADCDGSPGGCDEGVYGMYGDTMSYMNLDESISLFGGDAFGDKVVYFSLDVEEPILIGDYNEDGKVSAADFTYWADHFGAPTLPNRDPLNTGMVDNDDFDSWKEHYGEGNFGSGSGSASLASVPEPASLALVLFGLVFMAAGARRRARA